MATNIRLYSDVIVYIVWFSFAFQCCMFVNSDAKNRTALSEGTW